MLQPGGAERLAHADLAGALGDRHQHDVHDPDAAHDKADTAAMPASSEVKILVVSAGVASTSAWWRICEIVVAAGPDLVLAPQHALELHHAQFMWHARHLDRDGASRSVPKMR